MDWWNSSLAECKNTATLQVKFDIQFDRRLLLFGLNLQLSIAIDVRRHSLGPRGEILASDSLKISPSPTAKLRCDNVDCVAVNPRAGPTSNSTWPTLAPWTHCDPDQKSHTKRLGS
ncbi:hypothetical protein CRM22_003477 [Opisthorchis felineus]|uniref:Uncharacterized protein n=1 Tax=Opisthorchis felineus TaxID=147828 RepID=A0A4S2M119_OPIFE|nr:hypothetical protein CRM22_003477 [Opisthorchis felineus]